MKKWTRDIRYHVFSRLFAKFGPVKTWNSKHNPSGKKQDFDKLILELSNEIKANFGISVTPMAIINQIDWGIQERQSVMRHSGHVYNWIVNRASALETGLISYSDLPDTVMTH